MATETKPTKAKNNEKSTAAAKTYEKRLRKIEKMTQNHFDMWFKAMDEDVKRLCAIRNRPAAQGKRKRSAKQTEEPAKKKTKTSTKPERKRKPSAKAKEPEKARVYIP